MTWLRSLFARSPSDVDELAVAGLLAMATFCAVLLIATVRDHREPNPWTIGAGMGALLGAMGAGKGTREKLTPMPPAQPDPPPQQEQ